MSKSSVLAAFTLAILCVVPVSTADDGSSTDSTSTDSTSTDSTSTDSTVVRLYLEESGVYRVRYEDLELGGFLQQPVPSAQLAVEGAGESVPIWIEDGGDGSFDPGDYLEFVGQRLHGQGRYFFEHSRFNVYRLTLDAAAARRMEPVEPRSDGRPADVIPRQLERRRHLEEDHLMIRLGANEMQPDETDDTWFWAKMSHMDAKPFAIDLDLDDRDRSKPLRLSVQLRGLSSLRGKNTVAHHRVEALLDGEYLTHIEWDDRTVARLETEIPAERIADADARLELRIPERQLEEGGETLIDVVVLDWVQVDYPFSGLPPADQVELRVADDRPGALVLRAEDAPIVAYDDVGHRMAVPPGTESWVEDDAETLWLVANQNHRLLSRIELDRPSSLRDTGQQSDYLMIAHASLLEATRPLAEMHRQRGLSVSLIDVQDIYDEFSHGVVDPHAIRDFIAHAYHEWQPPRPRFVLLVGDASWDIRNDVIDDANYANWTRQQLLRGDRFVARQMTSYAPEKLAHRNLIPTWAHVSQEGHSASDNKFVTVDGDDFIPDLAIGRFPVTEPEEVAAIVAKTSRYLSHSEVGPWRRNVLWITNENNHFQRNSDRIAGELIENGYRGEKVYPQSSEADNAGHQATLQEALNRGQLLVHFFGHGGRHIWRTGPPDFRKNHDLFTLDHVETLEPNNRLPMVLSMTCYSAPFDHPSADSIGEKFLRVPDRGAVAVFAASWRNSPSRKLSADLVHLLTTPGMPIGVAIQRAKAAAKNRTMIEMYNLLGDPALELAVPSPELDIEVASRLAEDGIEVEADVHRADFSGQAWVEGVDKAGNSLLSQTVSVSEGHVRTSLELGELDASQVAAVQVYVWDEESGIDGLGAWVRPGEDAAQAVGGRR